MSSLANDPRLKELDPALHDFVLVLRKQRDDIYDGLETPSRPDLGIANASLRILDRLDAAFYKLLYMKYPSFTHPFNPALFTIGPAPAPEYPPHYDQSGLYIPVRIVAPTPSKSV